MDVELGPELLSDATAMVRRICRTEEAALEKGDLCAALGELNRAGQADTPATDNDDIDWVHPGHPRMPVAAVSEATGPAAQVSAHHRRSSGMRRGRRRRPAQERSRGHG